MHATLPRHHPLDHDILCIDVELQRPGLACCYLLRAGDEYAFIETGTGHTPPRLLALLDTLGIAREQVRYVMPTHVHLDHAAGAGALMAALPRAQLLAHPRAARHLVDPAKLIAGATAVYGAEGLRASFGELQPIAESRVVVADDGHVLDFNGRRLQFLDTPGHARHHYSIWDEASRGFFTGDTFGISYREFDTAAGPWLFPTTTPVQFEPEAWQATLDRYLAFAPARMYLTHYSMVEDVPRLATDLRAQLAEYVAIARRLAAVPERHAVLKSALAEAALVRLAAHGCALPQARCLELLDTDLELNAQGLEVWLDRQTQDRPAA